MNLKTFKYLAAYSVPIIVLFSLLSSGIFTYTAIIYVFGLLPLIELFLNADQNNLNQIEEEATRDDRIFDYLVYGLVPFQFIIGYIFLNNVGDTSLLLYEKIGMMLAYGMACGLSINNAHELGHRSSWYEQLMSKSLLMTTLYLHFFIEHNRGHHLRVATPEDPASSRYGESFYIFLIRSLVTGWFSAWSLESNRIKKTDGAHIIFHNEMVAYHLIQAGLLLLIWAVFGISVMGYFIGGAAIGILMLEAVNYIEHYGLTRKKKGKRYERTLPIHSWNSNHPLGRMIMLELSRHSDHHYMTNRKYQILRHFDESPQMPTGYPGMMLLALVPPLWFSVMHKRIDYYKATLSGKALG